MKLKENISIRKVGKDYIILDNNNTNVDFTKVLKLNASAGYLLNEVQGKEFSAEDLQNLLIEAYTIDKRQAEKDVSQLLTQLKQTDIIA